MTEREEYRLYLLRNFHGDVRDEKIAAALKEYGEISEMTEPMPYIDAVLMNLDGRVKKLQQEIEKLREAVLKLGGDL